METVLINGEEFKTEQNVTAHMAAIAASPWGYNPRRTKVQTSFMVNFQGRNRRIYCDIFGNSGSTYIIVKGEKVFVR